MHTFRVAQPSLADAVLLAAIGAGIGLVLSLLASALLTRNAPARLIRRNYRGIDVPVVLGMASMTAAIATLVGLGVAAPSSWDGIASRGVPAACLLVLVSLCLAGLWDDLRGDERPRGFTGHLGALRGGAVTGGIVKLVAGGLAGLAAGWVLEGSIGDVLSIGLLVALTANLFNLLDRAPGRSTKAFFALALPLLIWAPRDWAVSAAPLAGAIAGAIVADLREKGMLGDAGANPMGGVLGIGLALTLGDAGRWIAIALLTGLNVASERWSFGAVIESTPWLRRLDRWGRIDAAR